MVIGSFLIKAVVLYSLTFESRKLFNSLVFILQYDSKGTFFNFLKNSSFNIFIFEEIKHFAVLGVLIV